MNRKMLRLFCVSLFLPIPSLSFAYLPEIKTYYQHIESTTEYILLDTDDLDYKSDKYYFKIDERLSKPLSFTLNYVDYRRNYRTKYQLNNRIKDFINTWDYFFYDTGGKSLKLDLNLAYRINNYPENDQQDFDKTKVNPQLTYKAEGNWSGAIGIGINNYNFYEKESNDRTQYFEKLIVKKYFYEETTTLLGSVKLKQIDYKEKNDKFDYEAESGLDIKTGRDLLSKIGLRGAIGQRNTIEDEGYDEEEMDYDYRYTLVKVKTLHRLSKKLEASLRWEEMDKDYNNVDYNYTSFLAGNGWKYIHNLPGKDKKHLQFALDLLHSEINYATKENSSHRRNGITLELAYKKRGMWSYSVEFGGSHYDYQTHNKDRNVYFIALVYDRGFFNNNLKLNLEYKYQIKDNLAEDKGDLYQHSFRAGCILKF